MGDSIDFLKKELLDSSYFTPMQRRKLRKVVLLLEQGDKCRKAIHEINMELLAEKYDDTYSRGLSLSQYIINIRGKVNKYFPEGVV